MTNVEKLMNAGVIPQDHSLSDGDRQVVEGLSTEEVTTLISLKDKLGDEFIQRNTLGAANCFL